MSLLRIIIAIIIALIILFIVFYVLKGVPSDVFGAIKHLGSAVGVEFK